MNKWDWHEKDVRSRDHCARCGSFVGPHGVPQIPHKGTAYANDLVLCIVCDETREKTWPLSFTPEYEQKLAAVDRHMKEKFAQNPYYDWHLLSSHWDEAEFCPKLFMGYMTGVEDHRFHFEEYKGTKEDRRAMGICLLEMLCVSPLMRTYRNDEEFQRRLSQLIFQIEHLEKNELEKFLAAGYAAAWMFILREATYDGEHGAGSFFKEHRRGKKEFKENVYDELNFFKLTLGIVLDAKEKEADAEVYYRAKKAVEAERKRLYNHPADPFDIGVKKIQDDEEKRAAFKAQPWRAEED
ncbi:MAG: hypothetical protein Q8K86_05895 [Candidatus Nanopelagicaceae bacterium]|nr:hypothetical protein [Candidatus Nanopelagicaceae bacterium]